MAAGSFWSSGGKAAGAFSGGPWWLSLGMGVIGGAVGVSLANDAEKEELAARINDIDNQTILYKTELKNLLENKDATVANYTGLINTTETSQKTAATFAANSMPMQNRLAYNEFNNLTIQAAQKVGQAKQAMAGTGFRNTESQEKVIKNIEEQSSRALSSARSQATMQMAQSYYAVGANYFDADARLRDYQVAMENTKREYRQRKKSINDQIDLLAQERQDKQARKDWLDDDWNGFLYGMGWAKPPEPEHNKKPDEEKK